MSDPAPSTSELSAAAEELFFGRLESLGEGAALDIEELCAERPDLAADLRSLDRFRKQGMQAVATGPGALAEAEDPVLVADRYETTRCLDAGGMGTIFEVQDRELGRRLAMKVVRGRRPDDAREEEEWIRRQERLHNEARVLGELVHPGIVPVHDVGETPGGDQFFAMQLVEGRHLEELIDEHHAGSAGDGWTLTRLVGALLRACEAVAHAHSRGVVHRDLKPRNVMVGPFGETYVLDWGLAARTGEEAAAAGSPGYMPPEQMSGAAAVDPRADVYAAGAMLYHMLSGQRPYSTAGSPADVVRAMRDRAPDPLHGLGKRAPVELVAIAERAMATDPEERYPSMGELARDLRAYLEGRVVRAHATGAVAELRKWVHRNKAVAALVLMAVLSVTAFALQQSQANRELGALTTALRSRLYRTRIALASQALARDDVLELRRVLGECSAGERRWEWHYLRRLTDTSDVTFDCPLARIAVLSPDAARVVAGTEDGLVRSWSLATRALEREWKLDARVFSIVFRDGHRLLVGLADARVVELDLRRAEPVRARSDVGVTLALSADGRWLAAGNDTGTIELWSAAGLTHEKRLQNGLRSVPDLAFTADGTRLVAACRDREMPGARASAVRVYDVVKGELLHELDGHDEWVEQVSVTPDGRRAASGGRDGRVLLWDLVRGERIGELPRRWSYAPVVRWAGPEVLLVGGRPSIELWDVGSVALKARCVGHAGQAMVASVHGARFASAGEDDAVKVWSLGLPVRIAEGVRDHDVVGISFRPDSKRFVVGGFSGHVELWDAELRTRLRTTAIPSRRAYASFASGGTEIVTGNVDGELTVWSLESERPLWTRRAHDWVSGLDVHGERCVTSGVDATVRMWNLRTREMEWEILAGSERPWPPGARAPRFSPDGRLVAVGSNERCLRLVRCDDGGELRRLVVPGDYAAYGDAAFSADGRHVVARAFAPGARIGVWRVTDGELLWSVRVPRLGGVTPHFNADGSRVVAGSQDGGLVVFDAQTGERVVSLPGSSPQPAQAMAVHGDLVVLGTNRSLRFFDGSAVR